MKTKKYKICVDGFLCSKCDLNSSIYNVDKSECEKQRKYLRAKSKERMAHHTTSQGSH